MNAALPTSSLAPSRLSWNDLPEQVREAAESALGAPVVRDIPQSGGFSPGLASRLVLGDGRRVFAKAISADRNPRSPGLYRREIEVMGSLPATVPAPKLRWCYDDGHWVMLVLDDIDGTMPTTPWLPEQFARVMAALEKLAEGLTPTPVPAMSIVDDLAENFRSWHTIAGDSALAGRVDEWACANLPRLVQLESGWASAARGDTLLHADLRADNLLLTADAVMVVDWPYAVTGAPWVDGLLFLPSVAATSAIDPEQAWRGFRPAHAVDPDQVNAVLAAIAGDFLFQSLLLAPDNLPTLRAHQHEKGMAALGWLRRRIS
ncbi:phosphotransferase [Amycolatopsis sp. NPDC004378]